MFTLINDIHPKNTTGSTASTTLKNSSINNLSSLLTTSSSIMPFAKLSQPRKFSTTMLASMGKFSEEEQHFYNHHIIENFIESVREMNDVVLIPSKLKDLDPNSPPTAKSVFTLNGNDKWCNNANLYTALDDDLYSYYQMINVVKNDLFEPHNDFDSKKLFQMPKRKTSRQHRREQINNHHQQNGTSTTTNAQGLSNSCRSASTTSLSSLKNGHQNGINGNHQANGLSFDVHHENGSDSTNGIESLTETDGETSPTSSSSLLNSNDENNGLPQQNPILTPAMNAEQMNGQNNAKQLAVQFIHHLHSLYTILEHFTHAADFITERYINEFEQSTI